MAGEVDDAEFVQDTRSIISGHDHDMDKFTRRKIKKFLE